MNLLEDGTTHNKRDWLGVVRRLWESIPAALVGGLIGWGIAHVYAVESSRELKEEAAMLRKINITMLHGMENAGWVEVNWGADGLPLGIVIKLSGHGQAEALGSGTLSQSKQSP